MQQEKLVVHYPDHGSISSNETEDPFMEFPRSFEIPLKQLKINGIFNN